MGIATAPHPLTENTGIAFAGAHVPAGLIIGVEEAAKILAARNRHGKPNADVLRPYVGAEDFALHRGEPPRWSALPSTRWVADFPADTTPEEASLYAEPWRLFVAAGGVLHARADPLRIAIARTEWFLVAPIGHAPREFLRIEVPALPGAGLVVVASDDNFVAAVLQSGVFEAWVGAHGGRLRVRHVAAFPFPWPPHTERGALTRVQLEQRDRVVRADVTDLDEAVAAAYGWRDIADETDLVARLRALHESKLPKA